MSRNGINRVSDCKRNALERAKQGITVYDEIYIGSGKLAYEKANLIFKKGKEIIFDYSNFEKENGVKVITRKTYKGKRYLICKHE